MSSRAPSDLAAAVANAAREATRNGETQWAGLRLELPHCDSLAAFEALNSGDGFKPSDRFYWERPAEGLSFVGHGCVAALEGEGAERFAQSSEGARTIFASLHIAGKPEAPEAGPFLAGGFAFSSVSTPAAHWREFPNARLVLPRLTLATVAGRTWCTILRAHRPGDDVDQTSAGLRRHLEQLEPWLAGRVALCGQRSRRTGWTSSAAYRVVGDRSHEEYCAQVSSALRSIADGAFEKVVLARSVSLVRLAREARGGDHQNDLRTGGRGDDPNEGFNLRALLDSLRRSHPSCAIFAIGRASSTFVGATPECLVRLRGRHLETASLAGSAPRGRSPDEDSQLGRELLESKKEQAEHAVVVRALRAALDPHCETLEIPESPHLMRLQDIQHLETPISGTVLEDVSILDLLAAVHPTPAVAGEPREPALAWLAEHEDLDRGWYAGPVGFADSGGGGEFFAALRSSLLTGDEARLFAGAGIVEGSQPERELLETRLKLQTMLSPLFEI